MSWPVSLLPSVAECILGDDILEACLYFMDTLFFSPLFIQIPPLSLFCYSFFFCFATPRSTPRSRVAAAYCAGNQCALIFC